MVIIPKTELIIDMVCEFISKRDYRNARNILKDIIKLPEYKNLIEEFGFLYDFTSSPEEDEKRWSGKLVEYQSNLWYILSNKNIFAFVKDIDKKEDPKKNCEQEEAKDKSMETSVLVDSLKEVKSKIFDGASQEKGKILENAVIELFCEFFFLDKDGEIVRQELRRKRAGLHFGFDFGFECTLKENKNVKCYIEFKNLSEKKPLKLAHIREKLLQTQKSYPNIDHWILICPTTEPSNELYQFVSLFNETRKFPFNIQIWSPISNVREFFGLNPKLYDLFFQPQEREVHPSQWTQEKRIQVFETWKNKLKPLIRLPIEWERYMRDPVRMCFKGENSKELDFLYHNHVQMGCIDERRNILNISMEKYVRDWLNDIKNPLLFLLGEYGDGKTVFTYILSRKLAEEYIKNPSNGWIPIRFTFREYCRNKDSKNFLKRRLELFGADLIGWGEVKKSNRILVILDGFDELTNKVDTDSISKHINILEDCCNEFNNMKIIVTSRANPLEKERDKQKVLQRLPAYCMCSLAPINRNKRLQYLENIVDTPEKKQKLKKIERMHDPIDLASKPLFLQMIGQTLSELPGNHIDEIVLYRSYIHMSLTQKLYLLDNPKMEVLPYEIYSDLIRILESIAIKLQMSDKEYIDLKKEFSIKDEENLATLLWTISDSSYTLYENVKQGEIIIEDATARIQIRSLLRKVITGESKNKAINFFHRSMKEYFVASGICSTLIDDLGNATKLLEKLPLNPEILYFASKMMKEDSKKYEEKLSLIISMNRSKMSEKVSVGNVATLLYRLKGELPGEDWSFLNLDGADLSGADLSGKRFYSTSLRNSCLNNVNFEMADFRECDLTGVRIEDTSNALSISLHPSRRKLIAAYENNVIREWKIEQIFKPECRNIGKYEKGFIRQIFSYEGSDLCFLMNEEVILFDYSDTDELKQRAIFRIRPEYRDIVLKKDGLILVSKDNIPMRKINYVDIQHEILHSKEIEDLIACDILSQHVLVIATNSNEIKLISSVNNRKTLTLEVSELTCLCTFCLKKDKKYLVACGQRNGKVLVWKINISEEKFQYELLLNSYIHDGIVSSLVFLDEMRIISSGLDSKIIIQRFEEGSKNTIGTAEKILYLTVKCKGMNIKGLKGEIERKMLDKLIQLAEESQVNENM